MALRRRRAEAPATDRDELASILDTAFDAFVAVDASGRIARWNTRAEELFGWPAEEAVGRPVLGTALAPQQRGVELRPDDLWDLARERLDEPADMLAYTRSGRTFHAEVALSIRGTGPDATILAFVRDVSRRRARDRREQAIHAVTRALAHADTLEAAADEVLGLVGRAYQWNAAAVWVPAEGGADIRVLARWTDGSPRIGDWHAACAAAILPVGSGLPGIAWRTGGVANSNDGGTTADDVRAYEAAKAGLRAAVCLPLLLEGEVVGVIELAGVTRRPVETLQLDDLVAIQEVVASFIERRRARAESERAKREFLTLVSHELRTPLTSILGYVQLLGARLDGAGEAERRSVEIIGRNADRLHRLVGDLLLAAEVSRGELGLDVAPVCLHVLVRDAVDAARPVAAARGVEVRVDAEPVTGVTGDAGRLAQVLDNLLSNAIKFSHERGEVEVRLRGIGDAVELAVTDRGIGVPAEELARLAEQFFRASTAREAQVPGMGLGLALSRAIVEAHGGVLCMASTEGQGTTITVTLPRAAVAAAALPAAA